MAETLKTLIFKFFQSYKRAPQDSEIATFRKLILAYPYASEDEMWQMAVLAVDNPNADWLKVAIEPLVDLLSRDDDAEL